MTAAISLQGVVKRFGKFAAVDGLDLEIPHGTTFGLLGPNGAGKTTTIRMIMNITKPDAGEIRVLGEKMSDKLQERIGYLPEERGLYRKMKVIDQLLFFATIKGVDRQNAMKRLSPWIDSMDLRPWLQKKTEELSKGMQQKVQFLGTIVHDPEILILDEPFSGLDPINVVLVKDFLTAFKKQGKDGRLLDARPRAGRAALRQDRAPLPGEEAPRRHRQGDQARLPGQRPAPAAGRAGARAREDLHQVPSRSPASWPRPPRS